MTESKNSIKKKDKSIFKKSSMTKDIINQANSQVLENTM